MLGYFHFEKLKNKAISLKISGDIAFSVLLCELAHLIEHIFDKDSIALGGIVD